MYSEIALSNFLVHLLKELGAEVETEYRLDQNARADIMAHWNSEMFLIEVKEVTPHTRERISGAINQVRHFGKLYRDRFGFTPRLVIATTGPLPKSLNNTEYGITFWGREWILDLANLANLGDSAKKILPETPLSSIVKKCKEFTSEIEATPAGHSHWRQYQNLCIDIFGFLFCPPLEHPLPNNWNESGVNRRDFILPNYCMAGFWHFLRVTYTADYPVFDAKNYTGKISKDEILQVAHYLTVKGVGLFGGIITRNGSNPNADIVR